MASDAGFALRKTREKRHVAGFTTNEQAQLRGCVAHRIVGLFIQRAPMRRPARFKNSDLCDGDSRTALRIFYRKNAVVRPFAVLAVIAMSAAAVAAGEGPKPSRTETPVRTDLLTRSDRLTEDAAALYKQAHYADAEPLLQEALAIREKASGPDDPDVAASQNDLAGLYRELGRYGDAEPLYRRALAIKEKLLGHHNPALASSLNNLAAVLSTEGRYNDAEPLFRRALDLRKQAAPEDDPDVAKILNNLAQLYRLKGMPAEAERFAVRALEILQKTSGPDHPDVAAGLNSLAQVYAAQGKEANAEPLFLRALEIREKVFGGDHPAVAISLDSLGELYRAQHRYSEAEPLYRRALAIREKAFGSDHPDVAASLHDLAALYAAQRRDGEAEPLYRRSLAIREKMLGSDHPDTAASLSELDALYRVEGRDPDLVASLNDLAMVQNRDGRNGGTAPLSSPSPVPKAALGADGTKPLTATAISPPQLSLSVLEPVLSTRTHYPREPDELELARNFLLAARLPNARLIDKDKPAPLAQFRAVWKSDNAAGAVSVVPPGREASGLAIASQLITVDPQLCKGNFASARSSEMVAGGIVFKAVLSCTEGRDQRTAQYFITPRRNGGFVVFAVIGNSAADGKAIAEGPQVDILNKAAVQAAGPGN